MNRRTLLTTGFAGMITLTAGCLSDPSEEVSTAVSDDSEYIQSIEYVQTTNRRIFPNLYGFQIKLNQENADEISAVVLVQDGEQIDYQRSKSAETTIEFNFHRNTSNIEEISSIVLAVIQGGERDTGSWVNGTTIERREIDIEID